MDKDCYVLVERREGEVRICEEVDALEVSM